MTSDQEESTCSGVPSARTSQTQCHTNTTGDFWSAQSTVRVCLQLPGKYCVEILFNLWLILCISSEEICISYLTYWAIDILTLVEDWKLFTAWEFWVLFIFLVLHHIEMKLTRILHFKHDLKFSYKWDILQFYYTRKTLRCHKTTPLTNKTGFTELLFNMP